MRAPEITKDAKPGQFLELKVSETGEPFLRRPISINSIDGDLVTIIFAVKGKGTELLSKVEVGKKIDIMGPLGKGVFEVQEYNNVAIIGGGLGSYPLYELTKRLKGKTSINVYLGFRDKSVVTCEKEFEEIGVNKLVIATDDGSYKEKGFAIDFMKKDIEEHMVDRIFACGPTPMLRAIKKYAEENNIPCQVSLEERMGCGIGACLGCAVKVKEDGNEVYKHVCKDGPVFFAKDVDF